MEGESKRIWDTREFVAQWNAATEAHLVYQMQAVLRSLVTGGAIPQLSEEQSARLAPMLVHAFQVAAAPEGGVPGAIQYLSELTAGPKQGMA